MLSWLLVFSKKWITSIHIWTRKATSISTRKIEKHSKYMYDILGEVLYDDVSVFYIYRAYSIHLIQKMLLENFVLCVCLIMLMLLKSHSSFRWTKPYYPQVKLKTVHGCWLNIGKFNSLYWTSCVSLLRYVDWDWVLYNFKVDINHFHFFLIFETKYM